MFEIASEGRNAHLNGLPGYLLQGKCQTNSWDFNSLVYHPNERQPYPVSKRECDKQIEGFSRPRLVL